MHYRLDTDHTAFSLAHAPRAADEVALVRLSVDLHESLSAASEATHRMYAAAILAGCGELDRAAFLDRVGSLGADISVSVASGVLTIELRSRTSTFTSLLALFERMLDAPTFPPAELRRIRRTLTGELAVAREDARSRALSALRTQLFAPGDRRATPEPDAISAALPAVHRRDILAVHERVRATFVHVTIVGTEAAASRLTRTLTRLTRGHSHTKQNDAVHAPQTPPRHVSCVDIPSRNNVEVSLGGPLPITLQHPDYLPFVFGLNVLANWSGFAGRLMQRVREERGLTYMIYGRPETVTAHETGYWRIATFFSPADLEAGLEATAAEIVQIAREGITADEHTRFREIHRTRRALTNDSPERLLTHLHSYHLADLTPTDIRERYERFDAVTPEAVADALGRHLVPRDTYIGAAGPTAAVEKRLKQQYGRGILLT